MKTIALAAAIAMTPVLAFAMGCHGSDHTTAASCPQGQVWDGEQGACTDVTSS
ncbi:MAG: hypothetical protein AAF393_04040 [Pseudomonadota bacterium]